MLDDRDTPRATLTDSDAIAPSGGESCLVSIYGPNLGRRWSLDRDEIVVGREGPCDVMVPIDTVSGYDSGRRKRQSRPHRHHHPQPVLLRQLRASLPVAGIRVPQAFLPERGWGARTAVDRLGAWFFNSPAKDRRSPPGLRYEIPRRAFAALLDAVSPEEIWPGRRQAWVEVRHEPEAPPAPQERRSEAEPGQERV
jgi:hypothetical protein